MKTVLVLLLIGYALAMSGCAAVSALPSIKNCKTVKYERNGIDVHIEADCTVPVSGALSGL